MYDYMKALQERFDEKQPEHLVYAVQSAREGLRDGIDAESRRKLLRLLDAQNALLAESTLMSFTAGFKLAAGIAGELGTPYGILCGQRQSLAKATPAKDLSFLDTQIQPVKSHFARQNHTAVVTTKTMYYYSCFFRRYPVK